MMDFAKCLWVMSDETLVAMYRDANKFATDETLNEPETIQMRAEAKLIAECVHEQIVNRHSNWVLHTDGTITPEKSGRA